MKSINVKREKKKLVYLLTTGGTIGTVSNEQSVAVLANTTSGLLSNLGKLPGVELVVMPVMVKASANFEPADWVIIADAVSSVLQNERVDGVVLLHGTDTLHYTSAALSFMLTNLSVPVVITGSMIPGGDRNTDAIHNLRDAIRIAAFGDFAEVCVVFSYDEKGSRRIIIRASRARKTHPFKLNAFESINSPPIGYVDSSGKIKYTTLRRVKRAKRKLRLRTNLDTNVVYIKQNPALDKKTLKRFLNRASGAVIEGTGGGHVKANLLEVIKAFKKYAALTTQTVYGGETVGRKSNYEIDKQILQVKNFILTRDMNSETVFVKMMWSLGQKQLEKGIDVKHLMLENIAGEID
jgi:L-asparaginase type I